MFLPVGRLGPVWLRPLLVHRWPSSRSTERASKDEAAIVSLPRPHLGPNRLPKAHLRTPSPGSWGSSRWLLRGQEDTLGHHSDECGNYATGDAREPLSQPSRFVLYVLSTQHHQSEFALRRPPALASPAWSGLTPAVRRCPRGNYQQPSLLLSEVPWFGQEIIWAPL